MNRRWTPATALSLHAALTSCAERLTARGMPTGYYTVPDWDGYAPATGSASDVYCLDVALVPALRRPGHTLHALFQVFVPAQPNLGVFVLYDRRDSDGHPYQDPHWPRYSVRSDHTVAFSVLPEFDTVLAPLDPTGRGHSQRVDIWHGHANLPDHFAAPVTATTLLRNFRRRSQHAIIWVDYRVPAAELITRLTQAIIRAPHVHLIPRTGTPSGIRMPIRAADDTIVALANFSDALDDGIACALRYLRTGSDRDGQ
ncbi:hypothetical protein [Nocardia sp. NPDC052566]|uniref:hypothetical protein n=1 Tax=Nocardia sp. NPDC052566 TaxID=3364330 RepID=UPI0037C6F806